MCPDGRQPIQALITPDTWNIEQEGAESLEADARTKDLLPMQLIGGGLPHAGASVKMIGDDYYELKG